MTLQSVAIEVAHWLISGSSWPQSPPPTELPPVFAPLQRILDDTLKDPQLADLGVVVLNFGPLDDPYRPPAAAYKRQTLREEVGSVGKLAIAYAAYQLKADVELVLNQVASTISPKTPSLPDLPKPLSDYWSSIPALKKLNLSVPDLKRLFEDPVQVADGSGRRWTVAFKGISNCGYALDWATVPARKQVIDKLCTAHKHEEIRDLAKWQAEIDACNFAEHLWLETRWSDNLAATQTAIDIACPPPDSPDARKPITLAYIQAVLKESGLGDLDRGFWLNSVYQEPPRPIPPPPLALWRSDVKSHLGDAQSLARLMIALWNGELISQSTSTEMLSLLRHLDPLIDFGGRATYADLDDPTRTPKPVNWPDSFILLGMTKAVSSCVSKLGIEFGHLADWALVDCAIGSTPPKRYRLGIVVVNGKPKPNGGNNITDFAHLLLANLNKDQIMASLARP